MKFTDNQLDFLCKFLTDQCNIEDPAEKISIFQKSYKRAVPADEKRCTAITKQGTQCRGIRSQCGLCNIHLKNQKKGVKRDANTDTDADNEKEKEKEKEKDSETETETEKKETQDETKEESQKELKTKKPKTKKPKNDPLEELQDLIDNSDTDIDF